MATSDVIARIVGWLRAGYPEGVPQQDYIPLFALLGNQLTNDEVTLIASELSLSADPASQTAMKEAITAVTHEKASDTDIARVRARLAAGGWPLAAPARD
jgi:hypothetical protein